jgi:ABC-type glycerol-3-phosphate transport system permease component
MVCGKAVNYPNMRMTIMDGKVTFGRFWIRGLWVFLMFLLTNIFLGAVAAAVGRLSRSVPGLSLWISYLLVMLVVGLPFMGWIFEQFASRLPRLMSSESRSSVPA